MRLEEFWDAAKARLNTDAAVENALYGAGRVYRATDDYSQPEGAEGEPWGRVVLVPAVPMWNQLYVPGETWKVAFLTRAEFNNYRDEGYEVTEDLEAAQDAVAASLEGWLPTGFTRLTVALAVYRHSIPQAMPLYDDLRGLWWTSVEYRFEAAAAVPVLS